MVISVSHKNTPSFYSIFYSVLCPCVTLWFSILVHFPTTATSHSFTVFGSLDDPEFLIAGSFGLEGIPHSFQPHTDTQKRLTFFFFPSSLSRALVCCLEFEIAQKSTAASLDETDLPGTFYETSKAFYPSLQHYAFRGQGGR